MFLSCLREQFPYGWGVSLSLSRAPYYVSRSISLAGVCCESTSQASVVKKGGCHQPPTRLGQRDCPCLESRSYHNELTHPEDLSNQYVLV